MPFLAASEASPEKEGISGRTLLPTQPALNRPALGVTQPSVGTLASRPPASRSRTAWPARILPPARAFQNIKITAVMTVAARDRAVRDGLVQWSTCQKPGESPTFQEKQKSKQMFFFAHIPEGGGQRHLAQRSSQPTAGGSALGLGVAPPDSPSALLKGTSGSELRLQSKEAAATASFRDTEHELISRLSRAAA